LLALHFLDLQTPEGLLWQANFVFLLILIIYVDDFQLDSTFSHSELTPFHDETKEKAMWPSPP
jgi:hypothetical protein